MVVTIFVVGTEKLFALNYAVREDPGFKTPKVHLIQRSKRLKISMSVPAIPNSILADLGPFTPNLSLLTTFSLIQQSGPNAARIKDCIKLCPPAIRYPKSSIYNEPPGEKSFRCALYLGDDFLRPSAAPPRSGQTASSIRRVPECSTACEWRSRTSPPRERLP